MDELKDVQRLKVGAGDTLVVTTPDRLSDQARARVAEACRQALPVDADVRLLILDGGTTLAVVTAGEADEGQALRQAAGPVMLARALVDDFRASLDPDTAYEVSDLLVRFTEYAGDRLRASMATKADPRPTHEQPPLKVLAQATADAMATFRDYAGLHYAKGTKEADAKGDANRGIADHLEAQLAAACTPDQLARIRPKTLRRQAADDTVVQFKPKG